MKETIEKFPVETGETYQIRIIDTGMFIAVETNLIYYFKGEEKQANLRTTEHASGSQITKLLEDAKYDLTVTTIIKKALEPRNDVDIFGLDINK